MSLVISTVHHLSLELHRMNGEHIAITIDYAHCSTGHSIALDASFTDRPSGSSWTGHCVIWFLLSMCTTLFFQFMSSTWRHVTDTAQTRNIESSLKCLCCRLRLAYSCILQTVRRSVSSDSRSSCLPALVAVFVENLQTRQWFAFPYLQTNQWFCCSFVTFHHQFVSVKY